MDNFGDNFYFDVAVHDEIHYEKYIWSTISLEKMAEDAISSNYWTRFSKQIQENLDILIKREEDCLLNLEAEHQNDGTGLSKIAKAVHRLMFGEHKQRMLYESIGRQQEYIVFLHNAKRTLLKTIVRNSY